MRTKQAFNLNMVQYLTENGKKNIGFEPTPNQIDPLGYGFIHDIGRALSDEDFSLSRDLERHTYLKRVCDILNDDDLLAFWLMKIEFNHDTKEGE